MDVAGSAPSPVVHHHHLPGLGHSSIAWTWDNVYTYFSSPHPRLSGLTNLPGSGVVWRYIKSSHRNDPARTLLELLLFLFVVYTWLKGRTRGDKNVRNFVKLSEKVRSAYSGEALSLATILIVCFTCALNVLL